MKVLIAGLGAIGQRHLRNLEALLGPSLEVIAYRVRRSATVLNGQMKIEAGQDIEQKLNIRVFDTWAAALAQKPDVALICNPSSLHLNLALEAANAGCHLFIEKPLADNLDGVRDLVAAAERSDLVVLVGFQMRFHPCLKLVREMLARRAVGQPIGVRAASGEYLPGWHPYEDYRQSYAARADLGGGVVLTQIHDLDYLYSLFGVPRRVFAVGGRLSSLQTDVEDTASILMAYEIDGRTLPVHLHQDYLQRPPVRSCEIVGDQGKIMIDFREPSVRLWDAGGGLSQCGTFPQFERNQMFLDEMRHLLACLQRREAPVVTVRDAAKSLAIAAAAKLSMSTGTVQAVNCLD